MLAATTLTILFVPMFYVVIYRLIEGALLRRGRRPAGHPQAQPSAPRP